MADLTRMQEAVRRPAKLDHGLKKMLGVLGSIRWHQNGFLIGMLDSGVVVKGPLAEPQIGAHYEFEGKVESHPRFGDQFTFHSAKCSVPTELGAFRWYLESNAKWIGEKRSQAIIERFGADAVRVCKNEPTRVADEIPGISLSQAVEISKMLAAVEHSESLSIELRRLLEGTGIGPAIQGRIQAKWGKEAPTRIRENPYALMDEFDWVGFFKADAVALNVGYERDGGFRLRAGIIHVLEEAASGSGHVCLPAPLLADEAVELLGVPKDLIYKTMKTMADSKLVGVDGFAYLARLMNDEQSASSSISILLESKLPPMSPGDAGTLQPDQVEALEKASKNAVFVLTGAPGTGKTYTIKRIVEAAGPRARVELAAPTGKAAKRIEEQSGMPAQTMHRLLEAGSVDGRFVFSRGLGNPIEADLIVIDETSMVDATLAARFLEAVKEGTRLVFVGDVHQLPSVGPGNVLGQLIASGMVPFTELDKIKRQDPGLIIRNCHAIKNGKPLDLRLDWNEDFVFLERDGLEDIKGTILNLVTHGFPTKTVLDPLRDIQVIVPMRERTVCSANAINRDLRFALTPRTDGGYDPNDERIVFRVGDKVIQTKNDYERGVMNGDIGFVRRVDEKGGSLVVSFETPERQVELPIRGNDLDLAYALTCHKFQGSEARIVIVPVCRSFGPMVAQRNWLYTACSRARERLILVGERDEVAKVVARNRPRMRFTRLGKMIAAKMAAADGVPDRPGS